MPDAEELEAFFSEQGAVEILIWLSQRSRRFTDLYERVGVARATLSDRLKRGIELEVWEQESDGNSNNKGTEAYRITDRGEELLNRIDPDAALRHLQSLYNARQDFNSDREAFLASIEDATFTS